MAAYPLALHPAPPPAPMRPLSNLRPSEQVPPQVRGVHQSQHAFFNMRLPASVCWDIHTARPKGWRHLARPLYPYLLSWTGSMGIPFVDIAQRSLL